MVMSNEVRHLLFNRRGKRPPSNFPQKEFFSGGVRGGSVHLLDLRRRLLVVSLLGVTHNPVMPSVARNLLLLCFLRGVLRE